MENTGTYTSVSGDASATYILVEAINEFSFMWGSVDDYNMIEFWNDDEYPGTLNGSDAQLNGAPKRVEWINATILLNMLFDKVRFISGTNAFEYANVGLSVVRCQPLCHFMALGALPHLALWDGAVAARQPRPHNRLSRIIFSLERRL